MKNLKVFVEVKKICTIFLRNKTPFAACQLSVYRRTRNRVLHCFLKKLVYFFCLVMGGAELGPPNMYNVHIYGCLQVHLSGHMLVLIRYIYGCLQVHLSGHMLILILYIYGTSIWPYVLYIVFMILDTPPLSSLVTYSPSHSTTRVVLFHPFERVHFRKCSLSY